MTPKTSPNSSLKNGPTTPCGNVLRMSPIFLRVVYQIWGTSSGGDESLTWNSTTDSPGLE
ncbi:hypothetical protein Y695_04086 [Hydrogenophaga sp. T4]|nr:hypothetical protein Y695_04086 [Hydrogenophaga sp. T4]